MNFATKKIVAVGLIVVTLFSCNRNAYNSRPKQQDAFLSFHGDTLIQRIVCFKFKADATPEAIQRHMRGFANLKDSIPYILSYHAGPTVKGDLTEKPEYDVMHYCTYRNEQEIKLYSSHPVHLRFIQQNRAIWEKVLVINSRIRP